MIEYKGYLIEEKIGGCLVWKGDELIREAWTVDNAKKIIDREVKNADSRF